MKNKNNLIEIELGLTVKEAIEILKKHHGKKLMDEIALVLYDDDYEEIFYADCMDITGSLEDIENNLITEVERDYDFYGDTFNQNEDEKILKKAYRIKTKEIIEHEKLNKEEKFWKKTLLEAVKKENV